MKEGFIKDVYEILFKEIQSVLAITYVFMIGIGMLFNHQRYAEFGINIFQYSDVFDYLVAPFEDLRIIVFSIGTVLLVLFLFKFDEWWSTSFPKSYTILSFGLNKKSWHNKYRIIVFIFTGFVYLLIFAKMYGRETKLEVNKKEAITITFADDKKETGILIGKTNQVLFLKKDETVLAIPYTSVVKAIEIR